MSRVSTIKIGVRNTTGSPIAIGTFSVPATSAENFFDTVDYDNTVNDRLGEVLDNLAVLNEGIHDGDLVFQHDDVDVTSAVGYDFFHDACQLYLRLTGVDVSDDSIQMAKGLGILDASTLVNDSTVAGDDLAAALNTLKAIALGGNVVGPGSATDNALVRYNLATGKVVQTSLVILDDDGNMSFPDVTSIRMNGKRALLANGTSLFLGQDTGGESYVTVDIEAATNIDASIAGTTVSTLTSTKFNLLTVDLDLNDNAINNLKTVDFTIQAHGNMGSTETLDWSAGLKHSATNSANCTLSFTAPTGPCMLLLELTNGGAFTLTWPGTVEWAGKTEPTWTASGVDIVTFWYNGTTYRAMYGLDFG